METAAGFQDDATSCEIYSYGLSIFKIRFIVKHHSVYRFVSSLKDSSGLSGQKYFSLYVCTSSLSIKIQIKQQQKLIFFI